MNLNDVLDLVFGNDAVTFVLTMLGALAWLYRRGQQEPGERDPRTDWKRPYQTLDPR